MTKLTVGQYEGGERLDAYLAQQLPDFSRSHFQKLIKTGRVTVNGKNPKAHTAVKDGDLIEFSESPGTLGSDPVRLAPLTVIDETDDYLVIDKPSGLLVHPAPKQQTGTLVDLILAHDKNIAGVGDSPIRPGIVHRLDRDASGLMVIAKTQEAYEHLKKQFQDHKIKKEYLALVHGKVVKDHDTITTPLGRSKDRGRMVARTQPMEGDKPARRKRRNQAGLSQEMSPPRPVSRPFGHGDKDAKSLYDVLMRFPHGSLVKIQTETGRMHQVRVHMKSIGHPLAGDTLYAAAKLRHGSLRPGRMFLHAATLGFTDLAGEWKEFHSELPKDLHDFLEELKKKHQKQDS